MQSTSIPQKIAQIWGAAAAAGNIRSIPQTQGTAGDGSASFHLGFPPETMTVGGKPPFGQDFNGIINLMTAWLQWQQTGEPVTYDATFQSNIGGYPNGSIVQSATTLGLYWQSTVDNNTTNPDTGGAGWSANPCWGVTVQNTNPGYVLIPVKGLMLPLVLNFGIYTFAIGTNSTTISLAYPFALSSITCWGSDILSQCYSYGVQCTSNNFVNLKAPAYWFNQQAGSYSAGNRSSVATCQWFALGL